ncbi:hypothetical protein KSF_066020 [Reticulibacter mediterranei]|uniref:MalT-like TPR region domain-containing protein n=1 Tax=Reticulibacter mediterranei TaxID=2778369 RepID=A0A8J3IJ91_9CHLR|nr:tetratricopeptide repeat protein [Reticulibacter mediterranei]GHO96554.1 hypothetical protein KSF_066020 [Reticulibacter mediterranei]
MDFFNIADRDKLLLAEKIVTTLQELCPGWLPIRFTEAIQKYRTNTSIPQDTTNNLLKEALTSDLQEVNERLEQEQKSLLLCFDTFEIIEENPAIVVLSETSTFPDTYQCEHIKVLMAGRNALDWEHPNWKGREEEVQIVPLHPFSREETAAFIDGYLTDPAVDQMDREQLLALYQRTEGRPILIGLIVDALNNHLLTIDDLVKIPVHEFEGRLVSQINSLAKPMNWIVLFMAHVYHRFNLALLQHILSQANELPIGPLLNADELASQLAQLSFIRRAANSDDFVLHDEMRRLITIYCWEPLDPDHRFRKELSRSVMNYYVRETEREVHGPTRQIYIIGILYHRLFLDVDDGLRYYQQYFRQALHLQQISFARLLLLEVHKFQQILSNHQRQQLLLGEAQLLQREERPAEALTLLTELKSGTESIDKGSVYWLRLLQEQGKCYLKLSNFVEAAACFMQLLERESIRHDQVWSIDILAHLGYAYLQMGEFEHALCYFEEGIALSKRQSKKSLGELHYADLLIGISEVYRQQGKREEALRRVKIAHMMHRQAFLEGQSGEIKIGNSLIQLGNVYLDGSDISRADQCFREAYDIYLRANYQEGVATAYNCLGVAQMAVGQLDLASQWFEKAKIASIELNREQYIISLNSLGHIQKQQDNKDEAIMLFEKAITLSAEAHKSYQQAESFINLAEISIRMRQTERAEHALQEARIIATKGNYLRLLGKIEELEGIYHFVMNDYTIAFQHFSEYCHYMAQYNQQEYHAAVREITDRLLGLPGNQITTLSQQLIANWHSYGLEKDYPEFIHACNEILDMEDR